MSQSPAREAIMKDSMAIEADATNIWSEWFGSLPVGSTMVFNFQNAQVVYEKQPDGSWKLIRDSTQARSEATSVDVISR